MHNEFALNVKSEGWRQSQVVSELAREGHPGSRFRIGSKETLRNVSRETLIEFYRRHYSANTMKLVLMSPLSVSDMKTIADQSFAAVPNRQLPEDPYASLPNMMKPGQWIEIRSLQEMSSLSVVFPIPTSSKTWRKKPEQILSMILGDEGKGSLTAALKKENLISAQFAGAQDQGSSGLFTVNFHLTEKGTREPEAVLHRLFAQINLIRRDSVKAHHISETERLLKAAFETSDLPGGVDSATEYAKRMQHHPALEIDEQVGLVAELPTPDEIRQFSEHLRPENATVIWQWPRARTDRRDAFFGAEFSAVEISAERKAAWGAAGDPALSLSEPNPYIPTDFHLVKPAPNQPAQALYRGPEGVLYFKQESGAIAKPKGFLSLNFHAPRAVRSLKDQLLNQIYGKLILRDWNERGYPMVLAGYQIQVTGSPRGLTFDFSGPSQGLLSVATGLMAHSITRLEFSDEDLATVKDALRQEYDGNRFDDAYKVGLKHFGALINRHATVTEDFIPLLDQVTSSEIREYGTGFFAAVTVEALAYGNLNPDSVRGLLPSLFKELEAVPGEPLVNSSLVLPASTPTSWTRNLISPSNNNALVAYYQGGPRTPRDGALVAVTELLMQDRYYTEMRTRRQLGYVVAAVKMNSADAVGMAFLIQSGEHPAGELARLSDGYVRQLAVEISADLEQSLPQIRDSLVEQLSAPSASMADEFKRLMEPAFTLRGDFTHRDRLISAVRSLTAQDVRSFLHATFSPGSQKRISFTVSAQGMERAQPLPGESPLPDKKNLWE